MIFVKISQNFNKFPLTTDFSMHDSAEQTYANGVGMSCASINRKSAYISSPE